jgi:hypothetical protein
MIVPNNKLLKSAKPPVFEQNADYQRLASLMTALRTDLVEQFKEQAFGVICYSSSIRNY